MTRALYKCIHVYMCSFDICACARSQICVHVRALSPLFRARHRWHVLPLQAPRRVLSRYATAGVPRASKAILTHRPLTASQDEAVTLKRPCRCRPCCIASDDMLGLPFLPLRACSPANNGAMCVSSSCREVGAKQLGIALKTPASLN